MLAKRMFVRFPMDASVVVRAILILRLQYDYTKGQLPELTDVIIKNKAALFVCAVGVPPKEMIDKLHAAKIPVMKYAQYSSEVCCISLIPSLAWLGIQRYIGGNPITLSVDSLLSFQHVEKALAQGNSKTVDHSQGRLIDPRFQVSTLSAHKAVKVVGILSGSVMSCISQT
jgi:hypothetical protein